MVFDVRGRARSYDHAEQFSGYLVSISHVPGTTGGAGSGGTRMRADGPHHSRAVQRPAYVAANPDLGTKTQSDWLSRISSSRQIRRLFPGKVDVKTGRAALVLRAPEIPGDEAIDVRYVELRRVDL